MPTSVVIKDGDTVIPSYEYTLTYTNNTNAGNATVTVTDTGSGNYALTGTLTKDYTINQIDGTLSLNNPATIVYDGNAVTCNSSSTATSADISYNYTGDGVMTVAWYTDENGTKGTELKDAPVDAGTYWVGVSAAAGTNYKAVGEQTLKFTITGKTVEDDVKAAISGYTATYDGKEHDAVTVDTSKASGYTVKYRTSEDGAYSEAMPKVTDVSDSKKIYVEISRANYQTCAMTVSADVTPATITEAETETNKTYTGGPLTFAVSSVKAGDTLTLGSDDYTVANNTATNAGSYEMTIVGQGNYTGQIEKSFKVSGATITNSGAFTDYSGAYNEEAHRIGYDSSKLSAVGSQQITVKYGNTDGQYTLTEAPAFTDFTNGARTVYWQVTAPNHNPLTGSNTVDITKATIDLSQLTWDTTTEFNFDNAIHEVKLANVPDTLNIEYASYKMQYVGSYTATASATAKDTNNYKLEGTIANKTWSIKSVNQNPTITPTAAVTKGGNTLDLSNLVSGAQGEVTFAIASGDAATIDGNTLTTDQSKTGEVKINVTIATKDLDGDGTAEYNAYSKDNAITVTVTDKATKELTVRQDGWTFGETAKTPEYTKPANLKSENIVYRGTTSSETSVTSSSTAPTEAGNYTVTVTCETATEIYTGSATFKIEPKSIKSAVVTLGNGLTYSGSEQTQAVSSVELGNATLTADTDYVVSGNKGTNAGDYTLSITGKNNYSGTVEKSFTIAKKGISISSVTLKARAYEPGRKDVEVTGVTFDDAALTIGTDYSAVGAMKNADAGTEKDVEVTVKLLNSNYSLTTAETNGTVNISKAAAKSIADRSVSVKYSNTADQTVSLAGLMPADAGTLTYTVEEKTDNDSIISSWSVNNGVVTFTLNESATASKTATLPVTIGSTNYNDSTVNIVVATVDKDVPVLTVENITKVYDGAAVANSAIKGTAKFNGTDVKGTWSFKSEQALTNVADSGEKTIVFTPEDSTNYVAAEKTITVTISKAKPTGTPAYEKISAADKTLADTKLAKGTITPEGTIAWNELETTKVVQGKAYGWTFTPTDTANYETLTGTLTPWAASSYSGGGGGGYVAPTTPEKTAKTFITSNLTAGGKVYASATADNYKAILTAKDAYAKLSATEQAALDKELKTQTGKTLAELVAEAEAVKAEVEKEAEDTAVTKAEVKATTFKVKSKTVTLNGKKAIKISWYVTDGDLEKGDFDGFAIYRSTKKNAGYGKSAYYNTTKTTYTNNKGLKAGKTYYYKIRAYKYIDGVKTFTEYSTKAWRTMK